MARAADILRFASWGHSVSLLIVAVRSLDHHLPQITRGFWIYLVLAALPFGAAGFAVSGIFQQFADKSPLLYGADLLGAALGALTIVPLLDVFGGVNAVLFAASVAALGALLLGLSAARFPAMAFGAFLLVTASFAAVTSSKIVHRSGDQTSTRKCTACSATRVQG
jgi:MFS family permease